MQLDISVRAGGRARPLCAISYSMLEYHGNGLIPFWQRALYQLAGLLEGRHNYFLQCTSHIQAPSATIGLESPELSCVG